ncbi:MAG: DMT family transporter [Leptolyngbya sp. PLA3]|nr:MAG: DMT family transporter [Cyanobacteria bacterium CYA]MCE7969061.1 DMT family transporter [Leptolyngbya sp. PL-A3]
MSQDAGKQGWGIAGAAATLTFWSVAPVMLGYLARHEIDAWTANGWRYSISALVWMPLLLNARRRGTLPPGLLRRALWPAVINAGAQSLYAHGFYAIDPTLFVLGLRMQIVFVAIGAAFMFPAERIVIRTWRFLLGATLATLGIVGVLFFGLRDAENASSGQLVLGMGLAVASGASFGAYGLAVRRVMHGVPSAMAFAGISQYTAIGMLLVMFIFSPDHGAAPLGATPMVLGVLGASALTGIAGGHVAYYVSINGIGVAVTTAIMQLQPFGVGVISFFVLDEQLSLPQWICGVVAMGGAAMALWVQHSMRHRPGEHNDIEAYAELPPDAVVAAAVDERQPAPSATRS